MVWYLLRDGTDHNYFNNDDDNIQKFVLTGRVSQDPTEENFGRHRAARRRNEHPSLYQFGYDSNMIRMSRSVVHVTVNSTGAPIKKEGNRMTTCLNTGYIYKCYC